MEVTGALLLQTPPRVTRCCPALQSPLRDRITDLELASVADEATLGAAISRTSWDGSPGSVCLRERRIDAGRGSMELARTRTPPAWSRP